MITLHSRSTGTLLTSIQTVAERSWVLNNKGKCTLYMSVRDEKVIRKYMGQRNLIRIGHELLPVWGGVVDTEQTWDDNGGVTFTAWSGESLLQTRTPISGIVRASSPGNLFEYLIGLANAPEDLRIRIGTIYRDGGEAETTLDGTNLLEVIRDLAKRWDMDFSIDPILNSKGVLQFEANWYLKKGSKLAFQLSEGQNVKKSAQPLRVMRQVVNHLYGFGDGNTEASRPRYDEIETGSQALYGLMQGTENYDGVTNLSTVVEHVQKRLRILKSPRNVVKVVALDKDETFGHLRIGNTLPFRATSFGFKGAGGIGMETDVRIIGMRYAESLNECELTNNTEEYKE